MKLHSPAFEKAIRRDVAEAVRNNSELRKEFRRSNQRPRRKWISGTARVLGSFLLGALFWRAAEGAHPVDSVLMVINLWMLTMVSGFAMRLTYLPFNSTDIFALRLLPVAESTIFRWQFDKLLRTTLFCLVDLTVGFTALGLIFHLSLVQWLATFVLVPLTGAFLLALGALWAARFFWAATIYRALCLLWFLVFITATYTHVSVLAFIHYAAPAFNLLVPTGWPLALFHLLLPDRQWVTAFLLLPIGLGLWTFKSSIPRLRARFVYHEPIINEVSDLVPGESPTEIEFTDRAAPRAQRPIGVTAMEEGILSGQFLAREEWNQGLLERTLWRWFNKREKVLAEFVFPGGLAITRAWKGILRLFAIVSLVGLAAGLAGTTLEGAIFAIGFSFVVLRALAQTLHTGRAFSVSLNGGLQIPIYAAYPISFRDLSRVLLKYSAIQMPVFAFITIASLALIMHPFGIGIATSIVIGFNASLVFWGARLFMLVFGFSSGTGDGSRVCLRSLFLFAFFALFGLFFLILLVFALDLVILGASSGLFRELQTILLMVCLPAMLDAYVFFRLYGWFYNAARFDLISGSR